MDTLARTRLSSELRKEQILDATLAIISENGHPGVNTSEISRRVGIVPSALYRHFKDKEQLVDALMERTRERLLGNFDRIGGKTGDPLRLLREIFSLHLKMIRDNPGIPRLVFSDAVAFGTARRRNRLFSILDAYMEKIEDLLSRGQVEECISRDISPRGAAFALVSLAQSVGMILNLTEGNTDMTPEARSAWNIFERGITPEQKTSKEV
jgi:AcrR family transcriptional regulator